MNFINEFLSESLGLTKLPPYLPTLIWASLGFTLIHLVVAPYFTRRYFSFAFAGKSRIARNNWSIHVVSQVHALIVVPYALWTIFHEPIGYGNDDSERAFGWNPQAGYLSAIAAGYFLWDTLDAIFNYIDAGFVAHGVACFFIYTMSYKPFVSYYACRCLLWETSTIFLNNHWFLDKTGSTGTRLQAVNGFFLLAAFFFVRLIYGGTVCYQFVMTLTKVYHEIPLVYTFVYGGGNIVLQGLNWFWFFKMISALRKRFSGSAEQGKLLSSDQIPGDDLESSLTHSH